MAKCGVRVLLLGGTGSRSGTAGVGERAWCGLRMAGRVDPWLVKLAPMGEEISSELRVPW